MIGRLLGRRVGPVGIAFALWEIWQHIPPRYRKRVRKQVRKHGLGVAKQAYKAARRRR